MFDCRWQDLCLRLIVGERHIGIFGCGDLGGATCPLLFSLDSRAPPIAFDIHLEDGGVVHEAVDGGQRHCGIGEDPVPFAERLVGGYHQRTPLVSRADQLEQNRGFSLILGDIGKVVEDQKVEAIKPIDRVLEHELAARDL